MFPKIRQISAEMLFVRMRLFVTVIFPLSSMLFVPETFESSASVVALAIALAPLRVVDAAKPPPFKLIVPLPSADLFPRSVVPWFRLMFPVTLAFAAPVMECAHAALDQADSGDTTIIGTDGENS